MNFLRFYRGTKSPVIPHINWILTIEAGEDDFIPVKSIISKIIAHLDAIALREDGLAGLTSGFIDLDKKLCGLRESQFIIIAGRPSMGKTTFAMNIAEAILTQTDRAVLFFSCLLQIHGKWTIFKHRSTWFDCIKIQKTLEKTWQGFSANFVNLGVTFSKYNASVVSAF